MSPLHEHATDTVSWGLQVAAAWALRFLLVVAALVVLLNLLNSVSLVTITVIVAVMISALLQPAVGLLMRYRVPRIPAAILVFVLGTTAMVAAAWFVVLQISANASALGGQLQDAVTTIRKWLVTGPPHMSESQVTQTIDSLTKAIADNRASLAQGAFNTANSALAVVGGTVFCPVRDPVPDDRRRWHLAVGRSALPGRGQGQGGPRRQRGLADADRLHAQHRSAGADQRASPWSWSCSLPVCRWWSPWACCCSWAR